ncbi:MAG: type II secretion system F family protein [bacterium]|nr:type II secretion system F family protein [bacterium]
MKTQNITFTTGEKIAFIISLSTMLAAGITIIEAIDSLLEDAKGNQLKILTTLKEDLTQGKRIYASFSQFPNVFDKVSINIIKASEEAGTLDVTLKEIKTNIQRETEFSDKVKSALMYPFFILMVFIGVMLMILLVVMPKISTVFSQLHMNLPLPTKILIFTSNLLIKQTVPLVIILSLITAILIFLFKTQKKIMLQLVFSIPGISSIMIKIDLVRFTRSLAMLYNSGIIITNALELCEDVVINKKVHNMIVDTKNIIFGGRKFSEGLRKYKNIIPSLMIKIIEAGEKSGSLQKSLQDISEYLDYEVSNELRTLTALIEPIMLVSVGILVGGMMLSIVAPMYQIIGQVGSMK